MSQIRGFCRFAGLQVRRSVRMIKTLNYKYVIPLASDGPHNYNPQVSPHY